MHSPGKKLAFSLMELLLVIAIIAILAALLFPSLSRAKAKVRRTTCLNNLRQINLGIRLYADDSNDSLAAAATATNLVPLLSGYKQLMKSYVGLHGTSSARDQLFACPADIFYPSWVGPNSDPKVFATWLRKSLHDQSVLDYSSYSFNGGDNTIHTFGVVKEVLPGLTGVRLASVRHPSRTVLAGETAAFAPWSWHDPKFPDPRVEAMTYNNAQGMLSFVDGHVNYIKMYWTSARHPNGAYTLASEYDPPAGYEYQWSPD
jgi:prepilin-type N-terminal cleavage/methylation domain-containing protein